jgi:hypothetical protein
MLRGSTSILPADGYQNVELYPGNSPSLPRAPESILPRDGTGTKERVHPQVILLKGNRQNFLL